MTYSKETIKFSNQQVYWYFFNVGWGKTGPAHSFPSPKCVDFSIYLSVFWIMYLNSFDLYQAENEVFKPNSLLVLLHCGVGNDWAGLQNASIFLFYLSSFLLCYSYLNTYECPISKNFQVFKFFICTSTLWGGERLGLPILSPLQNVRICLFIFQS